MTLTLCCGAMSDRHTRSHFSRLKEKVLPACMWLPENCFLNKVKVNIFTILTLVPHLCSFQMQFNTTTIKLYYRKNQVHPTLTEYNRSMVAGLDDTLTACNEWIEKTIKKTFCFIC